jgi:RNA polymerase sigma-70 factor (ECF subfamily)
MRHKFQISSLYKGNLIKSISDKILVRKAKRGDREAYGMLYLKHLDSIYRYIYFRVNQDRYEAEDLTEIVFFKAWDKLDYFEEDGVGFRAWIYKIAHNLVIDHYRDNKKRAELNDSIPDESQNVEEKVLKDLESKNLLKAIEQLSEEQREVITMKFIEGFSNKEIGKVLNKGDDAVRALKFRALKKLRKLLS